MGKAKFDEVTKIIDKHGVILFMDEVYKGLEYDPGSAIPSACDVSENAVSLGVMSKAYGLAGLRIGWVATKNGKVFTEMVSFKDYTTICNSAPSEFLAALALRHKERLLERNRKIISENLILSEIFFEKRRNQFAWIRPKAGCIAFPRLSQNKDAEGFCKDVLERTGVLLAPSSRFNLDSSHFRIGFGRKSFAHGLLELESFFSQ